MSGYALSGIRYYGIGNEYLGLYSAMRCSAVLQSKIQNPKS